MKSYPRKLTLNPRRIRWDDWVSGDRVRKLTDENKELAQNLKKDLDALRKPVPPKTGNQRKKAAGSDLSSNRGSEERQSSAPATGRGQKRGRDNEIEKVGSLDFSSQTSSLLSSTSSNDARSPFLDGLPATGYPSITGKAASSRTTVARNTLQPMRRSLCNTAQLDKVIHTYVPGFSGTSVEEMELVGESNDPSHRSPLELRVYNIDGTCIAIHPARPSPDLLRQDKAIKPPRRHPAMAPINYQDRRNDNKRLFFRGQDPNLRLMIAGVPREGALHPLHAAPASSMPSPPHDRNEMTIGYHDQHINVSTFQEESFHTRPHVRIPCPDNLKSLLVDDWENVTKNLSLVQLPSKTPVNSIIDTYFEEEKGKRRLGSAEADLLEEIVAGVKEYFEKCLGRILLYRFEREQFYEVRNLWEGAVGGPWEGKGPGDVYGAEHLARLFGKPYGAGYLKIL